VFENKCALIIQRQVGDHVDSFASALRAALREDPDVIMVGEMRDLETISTAITAAETGHLVLGTLHTRSSVQTVQRIIDSFPTSQQAQIRTMLSESLRGVICQQLVPKADGTGRVAAYELLLVNGSVSNTIREGKDFQLPNLMALAKAKGMRLMDDTLLELLQKGSVSKEMALERANDPKQFALSMGK
ncbi:MAG TPA: ATPase, T2SS/T4P/T4SS family, partial [Candidatus Xenobia bacterium]